MKTTTTTTHRQIPSAQITLWTNRDQRNHTARNCHPQPHRLQLPIKSRQKHNCSCIKRTNDRTTAISTAPFRPLSAHSPRSQPQSALPPYTRHRQLYCPCRATPTPQIPPATTTPTVTHPSPPLPPSLRPPAKSSTPTGAFSPKRHAPSS